MLSRNALVAEAGRVGCDMAEEMLWGGVQVLGQDFLPYMDIVMPPLLRAAQLKPDVNITTGSEADDDEDGDDDEVVPQALSLLQKQRPLRMHWHLRLVICCSLH